MNGWLGLAASVFFLLFPLGLIMLSLGLFRRGAMECGLCGYNRVGLPAEAVCPECGGSASAAREREILRKGWQVWTGVLLLAVSLLPVAALVLWMAAASLG